MHTAEDISRYCHETIVDAVRRRRGEGAARAVAAVARFYGFTERRVVSFLRNQVRRPHADEYVVMRERARVELATWIAEQDARTAELRAKLVGWQNKEEETNVG